MAFLTPLIFYGLAYVLHFFLNLNPGNGSWAIVTPAYLFLALLILLGPAIGIGFGIAAIKKREPHRACIAAAIVLNVIYALVLVVHV